MSTPSPSAFSDAHQSPDRPPSDLQPAPAKGRPRGEGNDSLWKRAKRTLGTNSLTFLQPQSRPATEASSTGTGPAGPGKRREQVRHAQRVHRERTQNYIKTLESEVIRLRGSEAHLMRESDRLQAEVDTLKSILISYEIPFPSGAEPSIPTEGQTLLPNISEMATVSYRTDEMSHPRLHVNLPQRLARDTPPPPVAYNFAQEAQPIAAQQYHLDSEQLNMRNLPDDFAFQRLNFNETSHGVNPVPQSGPASLDTPDVAIEFVLALEHPCMTHIQHPATMPSISSSEINPTFHVQMASAPLISSAPRPPEPNTKWNWTASSTIIRQLLALSSTINLAGEITPVEAWNRVRQHPDFWKFNRTQLDSLKNELSGKVECCGFGAILGEQVFIHILNRHLAGLYPPNPTSRNQF